MPIRSFDHVAIPIQNTEAMLKFYRGLGFGVKEREHFYSVHFGDQKINFSCSGAMAERSLHSARSDRGPGLWRFLFRVGGLGGVAARDPRSSRRENRRRSGGTTRRARQWARPGHKHLCARPRLESFGIHDLSGLTNDSPLSRY